MGVYQTYDAKTNHEDLTDVLTEIGLKSTPVYSGVRKVAASNSIHEWSTYELADSAVNAVAEGASYTYDALTAPARLSNYTQIFKKTFQVSNTQEAVNPAGMSDEYAKRVDWALKEIGRDIEKALINGTANSGASATGRRLKGILSFITTNVSTGTGTGRALTELELNSLMQDCYENGGEPDWLLSSFTQQSKIAALMNSNKDYNDGNTTMTSKVLVYQSPFGTLAVQGDREIASNTLTVLNKDLLAVAQLRPVKKIDTPATADAKNGVVIGELTLEVRAEKMIGKMTGLKV